MKELSPVCNLQARQQADSTQAEVSWAAGQAAAAWAEVEAMESKGDAAGAAANAAEAVALQQQAQQRQAAASAAAAQAQQQVKGHGICWASSGQACAQQSAPFPFLSRCTPSTSPAPEPPYSLAKAKHKHPYAPASFGHSFLWRPKMPLLGSGVTGEGSCTLPFPLRLLHARAHTHRGMLHSRVHPLGFSSAATQRQSWSKSTTLNHLQVAQIR